MFSHLLKRLVSLVKPIKEEPVIETKKPIVQQSWMVYDPVTGVPFKEETPLQIPHYYREQNGGVAWLYDPWKGTERGAYWVGKDVDLKDFDIDEHLIFNPYNGNRYTEYQKRSIRSTETYAWLFNPHTGEPRDPRDIGSDPFAILLVLDATQYWNDYLKNKADAATPPTSPEFPPNRTKIETGYL